MAQIEICQECGAEWPVSQLVRKLRAYGILGGHGNYLLYSSYNSSFWTVDTASDAGEISIGCFADKYRPAVAEDSTTEARGSQTWTGSGTIRSTTATDISSLADVCFSAHVGAYHQQTTQSFSVDVGFCSSDGSTKYLLKTWSGAGQRLAWFTDNTGSLPSGVTSSGVYLYATVTIDGASSKWWADSFCLDSGTSPGISRPYTNGEQVVRSSDGFVWRVPILCPDCRPDKLIKPSEKYGKFRVADWETVRTEIESL